jgi:hypothetical protein
MSWFLEMLVNWAFPLVAGGLLTLGVSVWARLDDPPFLRPTLIGVIVGLTGAALLWLSLPQISTREVASDEIDANIGGPKASCGFDIAIGGGCVIHAGGEAKGAKIRNFSVEKNSKWLDQNSGYTCSYSHNSNVELTKGDVEARALCVKRSRFLELY